MPMTKEERIEFETFKREVKELRENFRVFKNKQDAQQKILNNAVASGNIQQ